MLMWTLKVAHMSFFWIVNHGKGSYATSKDDEFVSRNGKGLRKMTMKGWKMCVEWKDGSTSWEPQPLSRSLIRSQ
jgi:hypothetical protein